MGKESEDELKDEHRVSFPNIPKSPKKEEQRRSDESREPKAPNSARTRGYGVSGESGHGGQEEHLNFLAQEVLKDSQENHFLNYQGK